MRQCWTSEAAWTASLESVPDIEQLDQTGQWPQPAVHSDGCAVMLHATVKCSVYVDISRHIQACIEPQQSLSMLSHFQPQQVYPLYLGRYAAGTAEIVFMLHNRSHSSAPPCLAYPLPRSVPSDHGKRWLTWLTSCSCSTLCLVQCLPAWRAHSPGVFLLPWATGDWHCRYGVHIS